MHKVLIVEDDPLIVRIYENKFIQEGFEVAVARDGESAIAWLKKQTPDLVLLDLLLPHVNGIEILRWIRGRPSMLDIPVIVLTNSYLSDLISAASKAGANRCLIKATCSPKELIEAARATLRDLAGARGTPADPQAVALPGAAVNLDLASQTETCETFLRTAPERMAALRSQFRKLTSNASPSSRPALIFELLRIVHPLTGSAGIVGLPRLASICSALEALLRQLHEKDQKVNASSLRTVAKAIDALEPLFQASLDSQNQSLPDLVLVVDDEIFSRRAIVSALEKAGLRSVQTEDPVTALRLMEQNRFDLIITDIEMPNLDGFEFCTRLRAIPIHKETPVIFVTALNDFESRAKSTLSGAHDLIGKPFLFPELALKALTFVLKV